MGQITRSIVCGLDGLDAFNTGRENAGRLGQKIFRTEWSRIKAEIEQS
jgi:hypothetical protein